MENNKNGIKKSTIILAVIIIILTSINVSLLKEKKDREKKTSTTNTVKEQTYVKQTEEELKKETIQKLKKLGERDRMEYYIGEYIGFIEEKKYDKAYELLYPEFKNNYFKSLEDFEKYAKEKYPSSIIMRYNNIERQGDYYILFTEIIDADTVNTIVEKRVEQKIIVKENGYDDFYISFDASK